MPRKKIEKPISPPSRKTGKNKRLTVVEGINTTEKRRKFAKEFAVTGDKKNSLRKAGLKVNRQMASQLLKSDDVVLQVNLVRHQIRNINPLSMEEVKQLGTEAASFSIVDLVNDEGKIDIVEIKKRGLGRFVKEFKTTETFDREGNRTVTTEVKGYDRLQALRMLSLIQRDEENRDIQIVQALAFIFQQHPALLRERDRVFQLFAKRYNVKEDYIETVFDKIGQFYMVPTEKPE